MGSAQLNVATLVSPGVYGLNKQNSGSLLPPQWATEALNVVFDDSGRTAARKGWLSQTSTPISGTPDLDVIFQYYKTSTGDKYPISAGNNDIFSGVSAPSSIKGALTINANNWKFVNFNSKVYGIQSGHPLIEWNGTGNFAATTASTGTVPDGNEILGAFGRLWGVSGDGQTIKYSGLLDGTYWTGTGAGSINLTSVWANGADSVVALAAFNSFLVAFGSQNIVILADGSGSTLGLDPQNMYVYDLVTGVGCIARDSVQNINGDDLVFLSYNGLQSLRRVIEQKGNPIMDLSKNNRDYLSAAVASNGTANIRSTFNATEGMYLLLLPTAGKIFYFNTKQFLEDGSWRMTEWDSFIPKSIYTLQDSKTTYAGKLGRIFQYTGKQDNGAGYTFRFFTPWIAYDPQIENTIKTLKRISSVQFVYGQMDIIYKWFLDFNETFSFATKTLNSEAGGAEWGLGEWGLGEFGGTYGLVELNTPAKKAGQFVKVGLETTIDNSDLSLLQMQVFAKLGRLT